ncbi:MAG: choice-of-anchor D domain-containing protein [Burkholderiaceae bacterium]|nr:choice-of-anchor D domain-containing protein [Burkholderiaceae bacterium]
MTPLRGRLTAQDIADVAAYIGNPSVPSPLLRVTTRSRGGGSGTDRLDFGPVLPGQASARATVQLRNDGALPLRLTSDARIVGPQTTEFTVSDSVCVASATLAAGDSCEIGIMFRPAPGSAGLRTAAVQMDHDWVGATAAVALLGTAETSAANPPVAASSGGGGALGRWLLAVMAALAAASSLRKSNRASRPSLSQSCDRYCLTRPYISTNIEI